MKKIFTTAVVIAVAVAFAPLAQAIADSDDYRIIELEQTSRDNSPILSGLASVTKNPLTDGGAKFIHFLTGNQQHAVDADDENKRPSNGMLGMLSKLDALNCLGVNPGWRQPFSSKGKSVSHPSETDLAGVSEAVMPVTKLIPVTVLTPVTSTAPTPVLESVTVTHEETVTSTEQVQNSNPVILRPELK